jgi:hypothetical protein
VVEGPYGLRRRTTEGLNVADHGTFFGRPGRNKVGSETVLHLLGNFRIKEA